MQDGALKQWTEESESTNRVDALYILTQRTKIKQNDLWRHSSSNQKYIENSNNNTNGVNFFCHVKSFYLHVTNTCISHFRARWKFLASVAMNTPSESYPRLSEVRLSEEAPPPNPAALWFETDPTPQMVLRSDAFVLEQNAAARALIAEGGVFSTTDRVLLPALSDDHALFAASMKSASVDEYSLSVLEGLTTSDRTILGLRWFGYELTGGPFLALTAHRTADFVPPEKLAIALADANLTVAEFQVALALFQSPNSEEISDFLGISIHTVNTHLKRIFRKTRLNSKQDLILHVLRRLIPA